MYVLGVYVYIYICFPWLISWYHITYFQTVTDTSSSFCNKSWSPNFRNHHQGFNSAKFMALSLELLRTHWKFLSQSGVIWWYPETVGNNGMRNTEEITWMQRVMSHESSWISPAVTSKPFIHSTLCLLGIKWPSVGISELVAESRDLVEHLATWRHAHFLPEHKMENLFWLVVYLPLWKIWVRQLGFLFPIYGKNHVPNHQPVLLFICGSKPGTSNIQIAGGGSSPQI